MEQARKPPIGAEPAYVSAAKRIRDLAGAINRTAMEYGKGDEQRMKAWAQEIVMQCDILENTVCE